MKNLNQFDNTEMKHLVITSAPNEETNNLLSGCMDKYYFENIATCRVEEDYLIVQENITDEKFCIDLKDIAKITPICQNNHILQEQYPQNNICYIYYKDGQVITMYFDN